MKRVSVIGISGSGKTALARELAESLDAPHLELDSLYQQPDWSPLPTETFRARVREFVVQDRWVVDGNYGSHVQDVVWDAADTVVWPDLTRRAILPRLLARTVRRMWTREELWNGNREPWRNFFDPRPERNILMWMWTQHGPQRHRNATGLAAANRAHLDVHRLETPEEIDDFRRNFGLIRS